MHDRPKKDYLLRSPSVSIHAFDAVKYFWPHELSFIHHRGSYAADRGSSWRANQAGVVRGIGTRQLGTAEQSRATKQTSR